MTAPPAHADRTHALLSASSAHRWIHCTPSARLERTYPDTSSDAAAEGTAAHELAEHTLRNLLDLATTRPESEWHNEDMEDYCDTYADNVIAELADAKKTNPSADLLIEHHVDYSHLVPGGFGTADAIIIAEPTMTIIDFKYGKGVKVNAEGNPQMRLYAAGALHQFGLFYTITTVRTIIYQPRLGNVSIEEINVDDLDEWCRTIATPAGREAWSGGGELNAGEWCQFCRHAPQCTALAALHFDTIPTGSDGAPTSPPPTTLDDREIAGIVRHAGDIKKWLSKVEAHALSKATGGHTYPGLKLVEGRSVRRYSNPQAVADAVTHAGLDPYKPREVLGVTAMTKLLGKKQFDTLLGELVTKPAGKPALVDSSDRRPEMTIATPETVFDKLDS